MARTPETGKRKSKVPCEIGKDSRTEGMKKKEKAGQTSAEGESITVAGKTRKGNRDEGDHWEEKKGNCLGV